MSKKNMFKDKIRKWIVTLKRNPQYIPLTMLVVCCMIYTFQLSPISNASMYIANREIALYVFIVTLFSILILFSFINAYAKRQKRKPLMLAIVYFLAGAQIFLDIMFLWIMHYETVLREHPVPVIEDITTSVATVWAHLIMLSLTVLAIITLPLYRALLQKINTALPDEEASDVLSIDESLAWDEDEEPA